MALKKDLNMHVKGRSICLILAGGSICMQPSANGYIPTRGQLVSKYLAASAFLNDSLAARSCSLPTIIDDTGTARVSDARLVLPKTSTNESPIEYTAFEFQNPIDSCTADACFWNILATCIVANYDSFDGFVVLHGTDTLSYTASALSFLLHPLNKPVVLTGSQISMFDEGSDAWDNILGALTCAAVEDKMHCQVGVFFNGTLYRGNRTTKIHTSAYEAFATRSKPLSRLNKGGREVKLTACLSPSQPTTQAKIHFNSAPEPLVSLCSSDVAIIRIYPGLPASFVSKICSAFDIRGLVLETYGAGHMSLTPEFLHVLRTAIGEQGIVVVTVSQCIYGSITTHYAPSRALQKLGVVHGHDMTTEAAYTKLLWLLAQRETLSTKDVKALFTRDLRGELTEP